MGRVRRDRLLREERLLDLKLSHARGVLLAAAARFEIPVFEYEPRLVKKALVGYGQAEKPQVRAMVLTLLGRQRDRVPLDAADALAVAICHLHASPPGPWVS